MDKTKKKRKHKKRNNLVVNRLPSSRDSVVRGDLFPWQPFPQPLNTRSPLSTTGMVKGKRKAGQRRLMSVKNSEDETEITGKSRRNAL